MSTRGTLGKASFEGQDLARLLVCLLACRPMWACQVRTKKKNSC